MYPISQSLYIWQSKTRHRTAIQVKSNQKEIGIMIFIMCIFISLFYYEIAPVVTKLVLDDKYENSIEIVKRLTIMIPFSAVTTLYTKQIMFAQKHYKYQSITYIFGILLLICIATASNGINAIKFANYTVLTEILVMFVSMAYAQRILNDAISTNIPQEERGAKKAKRKVIDK